MGTVRWLLPHERIVETVASILEDDKEDLSPVAVVFQGKRPAHFLRRSLAAVRGRAFLPPRIFAIDDLVDYLYRQLGRADTELSALDAGAILYGIHRRMGWVLGRGAFSTLDGFLPLAAKLYAALEELRLADVHPRQLDAAFDPAALAEGPLLSRFYTAFYQQLEQEGLATRAVRYSAVAEAVDTLDLGAFRRLIIAGFAAFTGAEARLVKGLLAKEQTLFLVKDGPGIRERMAPLELPAPRDLPGGRGKPQVTFYRSADTHGEVFGVARKIKELLDAGAQLDERTVIVLPSPDALFPLVHWTLSLLPEEDYNISMGYPATRTPVFGFLSALFQVVLTMDRGRFYAPDYVKFVLHPYVKNILFENRADATRILFHAAERWLAQNQSKTYLTLEEIENDGELLGGVTESLVGAGLDVATSDVRRHLAEIHRQTIGRLLTPAHFGAFSRAVMDVLLYIGDQSTAYEHVLFRPFVVTLLEQLDAVTASRLAPEVLEDPAHYVRALASCLEDARVPFPGTPLHGVQVLGFLETRNLHFDRVFMIDMNDDVLPGSPDPDPFLPPAVRLALHLPGHHEWEQLAAYDVDALVQGAQEVHLFFKDGGQHEKSRFVERLLWDQQVQDHAADAEQYVLSVSHGINLANTMPQGITKTDTLLAALRTFSYSASAFDTYLRCPLRFHHAYLLRLHEKEEVEGDVDSSGLGKFVHRVLAEFDRPFCHQRLRAEDLSPEALTALVDRLFIEEFGPSPTGARYLMREQVKRHLEDLVARYRHPLVKAHDVELIGVEVQLQATLHGHLVQGYADRIERRGDNVYILDYKTGGGNGHAVRFDRLVAQDRASWGEAIHSLQLPLYALLFARNSSVPFDRIIPAYVMLGRSRLDQGMEVPLYAPGDDIHRCRVLLDEVVAGLIAEIGDRTRPFVPTPDPQRQCPPCSFAGLCGMRWVGR